MRLQSSKLQNGRGVDNSTPHNDLPSRSFQQLRPLGVTAKDANILMDCSDLRRRIVESANEYADNLNTKGISGKFCVIC